MRPGTSNPTALLVFPEGFRLFAERDNFFDLCFAFPGAEETIKKDVQFIVLSTASKNSKAILHFYLDELGIQLRSARLFKKIGEEPDITV